MIADVNNDRLTDIVEADIFLNDIRKEAIRFSLDKEVQPMLIQEEMAVWDETVGKALERSLYKSQEREELTSLYAWLFHNDRTEDAKQASTNPELLDKLLKEFRDSRSDT